jgi:hypothetical protein
LHSHFPSHYSIPISHSNIPFHRTDRSRPVPKQNIIPQQPLSIEISCFLIFNLITIRLYAVDENL